VPVAVAHQIVEKVAPKVTSLSIASVVSSVTSSASAALPTATGAALAFFRQMIYRAAGDEGLAENIAVPGQPLPYHQQQSQLAAPTAVPAHPADNFFHHRPHETVNRVVYRTEYQSVPCIDTSGQAFAIYLNLIYLAPLTGLFMRFFIKSYLRRTSPNNKNQSKHTAISKATRDASRGVERELDALDKSAEDAVSSAVHKSRDAVRGRKINLNGIDKDERHGSLSPANKKFVDDVKRKVSKQLQEIDETAEATMKKGKQLASDFAGKAGETKDNLEKQSNGALGQAKQAKDNVQSQAKDIKNKAKQEAKPYTDVAKDTATNAKDTVKQEADAASQKTQEQAQKAGNNASQKTNAAPEEPSQGSETKTPKKSKLPQKKKDRKETEDSGVLVKKEDAQEQTDEEVQKPEPEAEPKDVNNTLGDDEGKGLF
jgi:hypothetical protein